MVAEQISQHEDIEEVMLEAFRDEIQAIVDKEQAERTDAITRGIRPEDSPSGHFKDIDFKRSELTAEDMWVWEKIKSRIVQGPDLAQLGREIQAAYERQSRENEEGSKPPLPRFDRTTRGALLGYMGNRA